MEFPQLLDYFQSSAQTVGKLEGKEEITEDILYAAGCAFRNGRDEEAIAMRKLAHSLKETFENEKKETGSFHNTHRRQIDDLKAEIIKRWNCMAQMVKPPFSTIEEINEKTLNL